MTPQPYYIIDFVFISGLFEIRVNDIPMITLELDSKQMSTQIPINHGIHTSGPFEVTVKLLPVLGESKLREEAALHYKVLLYDVSQGFEFKEELGGWKSPRVNKDEPEVVLANTQVFNAIVPYQVDALWQRGTKISKIENAHDKLRTSYHAISQSLKNENFEEYEKMIAVREKNIAKAMYLNPEESAARFGRLKRDLTNGFDQVEFPLETILVSSAYGRKASLKRLNGDPALSFVNMDEQEQQMLDIEFYMPKGSTEFEII